ESPEAFRMMRRLYDPIVKREEAFMTMAWESSELTKYAANAMLAARISFMNEMTILCEHYNADIEDIRKGIGSDFRIGPAFLRAHDFKAMENMKAIFKDEVEWCHDPVTAAAGADAVALITDWPQYTTLPFRKIAATMNQPLIFDGRNCLHRDSMRESGFQYYPMGRPPVENMLRLKTKV